MKYTKKELVTSVLLNLDSNTNKVYDFDKLCKSSAIYKAYNIQNECYTVRFFLMYYQKIEINKT